MEFTGRYKTTTMHVIFIRCYLSYNLWENGKLKRSTVWLDHHQSNVLSARTMGLTNYTVECGVVKRWSERVFLLWQVSNLHQFKEVVSCFKAIRNILTSAYIYMSHRYNSQRDAHESLDLPFQTFGKVTLLAV